MAVLEESALLAASLALRPAAGSYAGNARKLSDGGSATATSRASGAVLKPLSASARRTASDAASRSVITRSACPWPAASTVVSDRDAGVTEIAVQGGELPGRTGMQISPQGA